MVLSGQWFDALALNAVRHRMGSRRAIETVSERLAGVLHTSAVRVQSNPVRGGGRNLYVRFPFFPGGHP